MTKREEKEISEWTTKKQICICPSCGYSRYCLEAALCKTESCPLCGAAMALEPRRKNRGER